METKVTLGMGPVTTAAVKEVEREAPVAARMTAKEATRAPAEGRAVIRQQHQPFRFVMCALSF